MPINHNPWNHNPQAWVYFHVTGQVNTCSNHLAEDRQNCELEKNSSHHRIPYMVQMLGHSSVLCIIWSILWIDNEITKVCCLIHSVLINSYIFNYRQQTKLFWLMSLIVTSLEIRTTIPRSFVQLYSICKYQNTALSAMSKCIQVGGTASCTHNQPTGCSIK